MLYWMLPLRSRFLLLPYIWTPLPTLPSPNSLSPVVTTTLLSVSISLFLFILLMCLLLFALHFTYKWNHVGFAFSIWLISLGMHFSQPLHVFLMHTKVEKYWPNIYNVCYILLYVHLPPLDWKVLMGFNLSPQPNTMSNSKCGFHKPNMDYLKNNWKDVCPCFLYFY